MRRPRSRAGPVGGIFSTRLSYPEPLHRVPSTVPTAQGEAVRGTPTSAGLASVVGGDGGINKLSVRRQEKQEEAKGPRWRGGRGSGLLGAVQHCRADWSGCGWYRGLGRQAEAWGARTLGGSWEP